MAQAEKYPALTAWRGICALGVVLFHFPIVAFTQAIPLIGHGYLFVDFFFVLSGFVIASAYEGRLTDTANRTTFIIRRFGRLWPLHVTAIAFLVTVAIARHQLGQDERHSVGALIANLALVHDLGIYHDLTWNLPSWSISAEAILYLIFLGLSFVRWRAVAYGALAVLGFVVIFRYAPRGMGSTFDYGLFRGLTGFFTGALLRRLGVRDLGTPGECIAALVAVVFLCFGKLAILAPLVFASAVYVFAYSRGHLSNVLRQPAAVWLGDRSYSIYMVHGASMGSLSAVAGPLKLSQAGQALVSRSAVESAVILAVYLAGVLVMSALAYAWIEQPGRALFNRAAAQRAGLGERANLAKA